MYFSLLSIVSVEPLSAPIALDPDKVELIVMACCSLHNFLRSRIAASNIYTPQGRNQEIGNMELILKDECLLNCKAVTSTPHLRKI